MNTRVKEGLNKYEEGGINLMSAVFRDYNCDLRVDIRALYLLGQYIEWNDGKTNKALKQAHKEVEYSVIRNLKDNQIIILKALMKEPNTNKAYTTIENYMNEILGYSIKKREYFNITPDLNSLGLFNIVRKREGWYYTLEVQMLMPDNRLIQSELKNRFNIKEW